METIICGSCCNTFKLDGEVKQEIYFPDRKIYFNGALMRCPSCYSFSDLTKFGEQSISPLVIGVKKYFSDENVVNNNIAYYQNMIKHNEGSTKTVYNADLGQRIPIIDSLLWDLESYKRNVQFVKDNAQHESNH